MLRVIESWQKWSVHQWMSIFLPLLFLVTPISSTAKSILIAITVSTIIFSSVYKQDLLKVFYTAWAKSVFVFLLIAGIACCWSPATLPEKYLILGKYTKFLYLPILVAGFGANTNRKLAIDAFLLAMVITCVFSILKVSGLIAVGHVDSDDIFRNHIMTGIMMAFAAYLSALFFQKSLGISRVIYSLLIILFSCHIFFINMGRTGYILYFLLMMMLISQSVSKKQVLSVGIAGLFLILSLYWVSRPMQVGLHKMVIEWQHYQENKDTSIGYRLQFHDFAYTLFKERPFVGQGTAGFTYFFRTLNPVPAWDGTLLEPHSQYWLTAAEFGLLGLISLMALYGNLLVAALRLTTMRPIALGLLLIICVGNLTDSLLLYSGSGYFFILFMALCLSEGFNRDNPSEDAFLLKDKT